MEGGGRVDEIDVVCPVSEMRGFIETCRCHRQKDRARDGETPVVLPQAF